MTANPAVRDLMTLVGRALIALLFIPAGVSKIVRFDGTVGYIAAGGMPFPELAAVVAIAAELGLGLLLLLGWQARWAALGLALFVAVLTPVFHPFWSLPAAQAVIQQQVFFKNLAVLGGLLVLAAFGPGGWSLDGRRGAAGGWSNTPFARRALPGPPVK